MAAMGIEGLMTFRFSAVKHILEIETKNYHLISLIIIIVNNNNNNCNHFI